MERGTALALAGRWADAVPELRRNYANGASPITRHALALGLLGAGEYEEGFSLYTFRHTLPWARPLPRVSWPQWRGETLVGRSIAVFPEQGLGDQIMFARFAPQLLEAGADVTLFCAPALVRLFTPLATRVIPAAGGVSFPDPDYWTTIGDLPYRLGVSLDTVPSRPYLQFARISSSGVGMMLQGNPAHPNDSNRSIPKGLAVTHRWTPLDPATTGAADMLETAELIAGLDRVVTVDTAVAHLAGAMGKPVDILLPASGPDWRWLESRTSSPWYPSATLYRQQRNEGWGDVLARVQSQL